MRLTTLFLLHCYIASITKNMDEAVKDRLKKFTYKTRITSRDFCEALIDNNCSISLLNNDNKLSDAIADSSWFFTIWKADPTVQLMLVMLDEIHSTFQSADISNLWELLINKENPPVTFHFLNMDTFKLTDELYIKMNARGRSLSEFENFKAWLQGYVDKNNDVVPENFWSQIDKEWTDFFWAYRQEKTYEIDGIYLRFFKSMAIFSIITRCSSVSVDVINELKEVTKSLRSDSYIPSSLYEKYECFNNEVLLLVKTVLDFLLKSHSRFEDVKKIFEDVIFRPTYRNHLYFFSLVLFAKNTVNNSKVSLQQWLRLTRNLIKNTTTEDDFKAVKFLSSLTDGVDNLYPVFIEKISTNSNLFFNKKQRDEELIKTKLIIDDARWEELFIKFEEHDYFYGQIGFLLEFAKKDGVYHQKLFEEYAGKSAILFSEELIETGDFLLQRALLSLGHYVLKLGSNCSFCIKNKGTIRDRNENWRKVFNDPDKSKILKQLLDKIELGQESQSLKDIISTSNTKDWRQLFIDHPFAIEYCQNRQVKFEWNEDYYDIYLLSKARRSGYHVELRTYIFYKEYLCRLSSPDFTLNDYYETWRDEPCVVVSWNDQSYNIYYESGGLILDIGDSDKRFHGELPSLLSQQIHDFDEKYSGLK